MATHALDCSTIDEQDYEARYLQGALTEDEAEAYEAHYFGCDRCWTTLQRALELRAMFVTGVGQTAEATAPALASPSLVRLVPPDSGVAGSGRGVAVPGLPRGRRWTSRWWPAAAAAAAAAALLMVATWRWQSSRLGSPIDVERGVAADLHVRSIAGVDSIGAAWPHVPGAEVYRVRLFTADGTLLVDRGVLDTSVSVARSAIVGATASTTVWSVEAVDATRRSLARSRLTPAESLAPSR